MDDGVLTSKKLKKSDCQVGPKIGQNEVLAQKDKLQKIING